MRMMLHKYLVGSSVPQVGASSNASPACKGILRARDYLQEGFDFRFGNGRSSMWYDDWSGTERLAEQVPYVHITDTTTMLVDLLRGGLWSLDDLYTEVPPDAQLRLQQIAPHMVKEAFRWLNG